MIVNDEHIRIWKIIMAYLKVLTTLAEQLAENVVTNIH